MADHMGTYQKGLTVRCPACGNLSLVLFIPGPLDREYFFRRNTDTSYYKCSDCGSLSQFPWPTLEETKRFYHADYQNYERASSGTLRLIFRVFQKFLLGSFLSKVAKEAEILDFGCGQGAFLEGLADLGYTNLWGYDVVAVDRPGARFTVISTADGLTKCKSQFDVIRINHVIEHLSDLEENMRLLTYCLKPGGIIIGQTPNASHYTARWFGSFWGALHFPYHLCLFTPRGLEEFGRRIGLTLSGVRPTIVPTGWSMSFENWIKPRIFPGRPGRSPIYSGLLMISLPFVFLDRLLASWLNTAVIDFIYWKEDASPIL